MVLRSIFVGYAITAAVALCATASVPQTTTAALQGRAQPTDQRDAIGYLIVVVPIVPLKANKVLSK